MSIGKLIGVGAGPGAPDLLTLRAKRVIETADVLALPRSGDFSRSVAFQIIETATALPRDQTRLFLTFPMSKDPGRVRPAVNKACDAIEQELMQGKTVAFVTEGDPSTFSTFIYVRKELARRAPELEIEVVPGVSSIMAVPAVAGLALADGHERVAILSGTSGFSDLAAVLVRFDTVVLMKVGPELEQIANTLTEMGLLDQAVYVSRATMPEQRIERDLRCVLRERGDCFAMVVIKKHGRSGVLLGENTAEASTQESSHV